jgi:hypothetical protein
MFQDPPAAFSRLAPPGAAQARRALRWCALSLVAFVLFGPAAGAAAAPQATVTPQGTAGSIIRTVTDSPGTVDSATLAVSAAGGGGKIDWWDTLFVVGVVLAGRRGMKRKPEERRATRGR